MEKYEIIKDIGSGNFGVAKLVREKWSGELYAVKFIERGFKVTLFFPFYVFRVQFINDVLFNFID